MKVEDKLAIHEVLNRAAYGYDSHNLEILGECFAADAVFSVQIVGEDLIGPFEGHRMIIKMMANTMKSQQDKRLHNISNIFFEVEEDEAATVLSSLTLTAIENKKITLLTTGIYRDEVVKVDGIWKIRKRHLDLELSH